MKVAYGVLLTVVTLLGAAPAANAAGPELSVGASCETTTAGTGVSVTVPIAFRTGTNDAGQPNTVAAVDLRLTFPQESLAVTAVRLADRLTAAGWPEASWEGSLGVPQIPGAVGIGIVPPFDFPVPTLTDGPLVEVVFTTTGDGHARCVPITIVPASVVFSEPHLGLAVTPGPLASGGLTVTELCDNCADDDGDGLIDLTDPDCGAKTITKLKVTVQRKAGAVKKVRVKGVIQEKLADIEGPARVELRAGGVTPPACAAVEAPFRKRKGKKNPVYTYLGSGGTKLVLKVKKTTTVFTGTVKGVDVSPEGTELSLALRVGSVRAHAVVPRKKSNNKGQTYE